MLDLSIASLPPSASPSASSPLRLGTFNVGLGFMRKLPAVLQQCAALSLDAVALQEIGDPALPCSRLPPYHLVYAAGPSHHQAGVGLLLSLALVPFIRSYHRSATGRLVGAVLELTKGHRLLLVSAYMPSGIDHSGADSEQHRVAHELYVELMRWTVGVAQVLVMGDLNETLTPLDRSAPLVRLVPPAASPLHCLVQQGYTDVWRHLHPAAPGFTHVLDGLRPSRSRLDYVWSKGIGGASLLHAHISAALRDVSHHRLLWVELQLPHGAVPGPPPPLAPPLRVPNLRSLSDTQRESFSNALLGELERDAAALLLDIPRADAASLSLIAAHLTRVVRDAAWAKLPITADRPLHSRCVLQLQRQRRDLTSLLRTAQRLLRAAPAHLLGHTHCLTQSRAWRQQHRRCVELHQLQWTVDAWYAGDAHAWLADTQQLLVRTRSNIRHEQRRMLRSRAQPLDANPAAQVHRMLQSDALPATLLSVIDEKGPLVSSPPEVEAVMVEHFRSVFAKPPPAAADPAVPAPPIPAMLLDKSSVRAAWYDSLLDDVKEQELFDTIADFPLISAPGLDQVSSGLWKLALQQCPLLRQLVAALFTACLRSSVFPAAWKTSIIVPLVKDAQKERTMSNVRPISLQSCLGKLLNKLLAHRLGRIFASHPILHPAQRGFVNGGTITKCIDELLDAWDWSRSGKRELYTLLYDIRQAYDSVESEVLERAMQRLRMPAAFIALVVDSLTGLSSCVRTPYGLSSLFDVERSLRQGDPLAPLLFVILMDALHDGLERNPFTGQQHGLCMAVGPAGSREQSLPSLGYADDTSVMTSSLPNLRVQNEWVHYFMRFNRMRLNHAKCELVGRNADGEAVTAAELVRHGIAIDGHALQSVAHDQPIRYLGVHVTFDGSWKAQCNRSLAKIGMFTRALTKFKVTLKQAVYVLNVFLLPALNLALHYVHGPGTTAWLKSCDRLFIGCIKHAVSSPLLLSHSAVALSLGLTLPSWLEPVTKVSELFLRMNDSDARWAQLGRSLMRQTLPADIALRTPLPHADNGQRLARAARLAVSQLGWSLHLTDRRAAARRLQHLFDRPPVQAAVPTLDHSSSAPRLQLAAGPAHLAHDLWQGWGADAPPHTVHAYTDGSHDGSASDLRRASSWAVTIGDAWLEASYGGVPADEKLVQPHHVAGASLSGAAIQCTRGIYPAELQAIARTLAMFPASFTLHIHSDSQSSLDAIHTYESLTNERRRLRMAARTLLQLIHHLLLVRRAAGGSVVWHHVRAHTTAMDIASVGNRLSDFQANLARSKPDDPKPLSLRELPLHECEPYLRVVDEQGSGLQLIDDIRRSAVSVMRAKALRHWKDKPPDGQGYFADDAAIALGRVVLSAGTAEQQRAFVHIATNSIHFHLAPVNGDRDTLAVTRLHCESCDATLTVEHLATCPAAASAAFRARLQRHIIRWFRHHAPCAAWCDEHQPLRLTAVLLSLFPLPAAVVDSPPGSVERQRHLTFVMCGMVTLRQASTAFRGVGLIDAVDRVRALQQLRLLCVQHLHQHYTDLKSR